VANLRRAERSAEVPRPLRPDHLADSDARAWAWEQVQRNKGAAGIDAETIQAVDAYAWSGCWWSCRRCCRKGAIDRKLRLDCLPAERLICLHFLFSP
jgi:hypothetical protein